MSDQATEDFLEVDPKIPGQNFVCLSFVSPDKLIKNKEVFIATKFLEYVVNGEEPSIQEFRGKMLNKEVALTYDNVHQLYEDWKYTRNQDLEAEFFEMNDYKTTMRGLKVRGVYDTHKEANIRAQVLRKKDPSFNVFVGQVGYWLPWDPEAHDIPEQEYQENQLNELVKKYKENLSNRDDLYEQEKNERIEKARREINAKKEALRSQSDTNQVIPDNNEETDTRNIEQLRTIVDESDKLYYDNLKKNEKSGSDEEVPTQDADVVNTPEDQLNNFKSESMENLESDDPWMNRKNET
jgi:hypothetical protein